MANKSKTERLAREAAVHMAASAREPDEERAEALYAHGFRRLCEAGGLAAVWERDFSAKQRRKASEDRGGVA